MNFFKTENNLRIILITASLVVNSLLANDTFFQVTAKNGLNLRETKGISNSSLKLLPEGMRVKFLEYSNKEETIQGKKGRWAKVKWLNLEGWVFNAYTKETEKKDLLSNYLKYLENLPSAEVNSLRKARKYFFQNFKPNSKDAENAYRILREFNQIQSFAFIEKYGNEYSKTGSLNKKLENDLKEVGIDVWGCEGLLGFTENFNQYLKDLKNYSFPLKKYFKLAEKVGNPYSCDAGIGITWEEIRSRIQLIENYLKENKTFPEKNELEEELIGYFQNYIFGQDNTPTCPENRNKEEETYILDSEVKKSYQLFLKQNKASRYYPLIQKIYLEYKKNDFKCTNEIYQFRVNLLERKD